MLTAKNSRKRIEARSPATATSTGKTAADELIGTGWFMSAPAALHRSSASHHAEACGSRGRTRPVSPIRRRLVVAAIDRQSREVTIEQGSGAPVTDNGQIIVGG